ncbi:S-layer homology domain-containing protein [Fenollaria timonensis]|uniref:S-layer homology domain-containing protein n=1 Tax=Fenollaria timonensis TaxID=1723384 RepID=UPI0009E649BB|nr:S-layer homology domain-containing protein [Fenollaria timonensis]
MKKILSMLMAVVMLLCLVPVQLMAEDANEAVVLDNGRADGLELGDEIVPERVGEPLTGDENVTLVGQWINDSTKKENTPKHYELTDKIGYPLYNSGLLRGLAKQFLGWSDKAPVDNGVLADGAKLYSPEDTIADVFGSSIPADAKIYAVYYEINKPFGDPLPKNPFALLVPGQLATEIKNRINANKIMIDESLKAEDILKGTDNYSSDGVIIDKYKKTDDDKTINEVVLNSELEMDWVAAMLAYKNIAGSNQILPILSRNYGERFKNNDFPTDDGKAAGYTHVDLNMDFGTDEGLVIPDELFLEFKSYSWRPLYAFGIKDDGTKDVLNSLDDYKTLVKSDNPRTKFSVKTKYKAADGKDKNYRKITVRVVLRQWDPNDKNTNRGFTGERIHESKIKKGPQGTVASEILSNMTLRVLGSADGIDKKNIVRITDARAKELADSEGKESITITGSIKGYMLSSLGTAQVGKFNVPLESDAEIDERKANELKLSYVHEKDEPTPKPTEPNTLILTLDENHRGGEITNIEVEEGDLIEPHLYIPRRRGYIFKGWSYDRDHLDEVKPGDRIYTNTTLYAIWKKAEIEREEEPVEIKGEDHKTYIFGYPDGSVRPNGSITRAEAAAMLARLLNIEAIGSVAKPNFTDTDSSWYNKAINAVVFRGIMKGYPDGRFRPNAPITRAEFTQMISTIDNKPYGVAPFADVPGHWAERAIGSEYQAKRITGYPDGLFRPDANITRAEAAVILNKIFERKYDNLSLLKCKNPQMIKRFTDLDESFWGWNDMVEATNTHEYVRRYKEDVLKRVEEDWLLIK